MDRSLAIHSFAPRTREIRLAAHVLCARWKMTRIFKIILEDVNCKTVSLSWIADFWMFAEIAEKPIGRREAATFR